ncbi:hypothetical protein [Pseudoalteromonas rubra]|uniref:Uncharacterized protein n=1 Tax=Pseudoalteromonas rubra TaxID=43658 RepID=A0A0U2P9Y6_9GAMM|nr:hypothetical protein [Pseudoalteromonas rubra]ALU43917.1 hypothetical protein AT705_13770 [Pseudoalteromonas rubra]
MKKYLILVVAILALFTIDHPSIKEPREQIIQYGVDLLGDTSKAQYSLAAKLARQQIKKELTLTESEQNYIMSALSTNEKMKVFHLKFCEGNELNMYFYGPKLLDVCEIAAGSLREAGL